MTCPCFSDFEINVQDFMSVLAKPDGLHAGNQLPPKPPDLMGDVVPSSVDA